MQVRRIGFGLRVSLHCLDCLPGLEALVFYCWRAFCCAIAAFAPVLGPKSTAVCMFGSKASFWVLDYCLARWLLR